jgi:hypothetical protein
MTTVNYPSPVTVNGYSCKNCTDVDYAKKNIDPAHPTDGPFGVNAKDKPSSASPPSPSTTPSRTAPPPAVRFGGVLAGLSAVSDPSRQPTATQGLRLDVSA